MRKKELTEDMSPEQVASEVVRLRKDVNLLIVEMREVRVLKNSIDGDAFMDVDWVCKYLNISDRQLRRYKRAGLIIPTYIGRRCLYRSSEIKRFIDEVLGKRGVKWIK